MLWREKTETMLARRVRQCKIGYCIDKAGVHISDNKDSMSARNYKLLELVASIGKQCFGMEDRPSTTDIRKQLSII